MTAAETRTGAGSGRLATDLLVIAGFCAFLFFFGLSAFGLVGADEPRYAQIAREMLARHDWVTPILYGKPWLEKPVLYYWEAMISFRLFGVSDWAARLPSAVDATALVFAVYAFARRFLRGVQLDAALMVASLAAMVGYARAASTDMPLAATFGIAMLAWAAWYLESTAYRTGDSHPERSEAPAVVSEGHGFSRAGAGTGNTAALQAAEKLDSLKGRGFSRAVSHLLSRAALAAEGQSGRLLLAAFYVFLALATLAKGPIAPFFAAAIIVAMAVLRRDLRIATRTLWLTGILLYFVVALPWFVLAQLHTGTFLRVFFLTHNLERFTTPRFHHTQPFWYYGAVTPLALVPWVVIAIAGLIKAIRNSLASSASSPAAQHSVAISAPEARPQIAQDGPGLSLFLILWALAPPVFFSFSDSKLPGYILPSALPFALLAAMYLRRKLLAGERVNVAVMVLHSLVAAATLSAALLSSYLVLKLRPTSQAWTLALAVGGIVFVAFALTLRLQGLKALRFVTLVPVILGLAFVVRFAAPLIDNTLSARPVERELAQLQVGPRRVAGFNIPRELEYGLAFYRNQPVAMYNRGEIPPVEHLVIAHRASESNLQALVPDRRLLHVGSFAPQGLEFYWVSLTPPPAAMPGMEHMGGEHHPPHHMK